jgi:hypothetical protein
MNGALWNEISAYVASVTIDRDDSHGHAHMQEVAWLSMDISRCLHQKGLSCPSTKELVMCVAWLHDVSDHKYDPEGKMRQQTIDFLSKHHMDTTLIMNIIDLISYSREVSDRQHEDYRQRWEKLLGVDGLLIRDIVSDADKITALGASGYERCADYVRSRNTRTPAQLVIAEKSLAERIAKKEAENGLEVEDEAVEQLPPFLSPEEVYDQVRVHAYEKLVKLSSQFIMTIPGKEMADPLHGELMGCLTVKTSVELPKPRNSSQYLTQKLIDRVLGPLSVK